MSDPTSHPTEVPAGEVHAGTTPQAHTLTVQAEEGDGNGHHHPEDPSGKYLATMALGALGVVYGDIGTSPLYAMRESFHGLQATRDNVLGILSLIVWALILVVTIKYVILILRADNHGEGGILALTTRVKQSSASDRKWFPVLMTLGLFGTALLYGDGMITPAISVLSAVEGLELAYPSLGPYIIAITVAILVVLFSVQSSGTEKMGKAFGPITLLWFLVLAGLGVAQIVQEPSVLAAVSPHYGLKLIFQGGLHGFLVLGSIFLVATGGEALYADMGHFGRKPIRYAWFYAVFPALLLNYFGQGALLLRDPSARENPFFRMTPSALLLPIVFLATAATVIASQALISGAFSLTMQAIRSNYLPRLAVNHTSAKERGQIYVPAINWLLMIACIMLVLGFRTSSNLAAAYGVGVNLDMLIATTLFIVLVIYDWKWPMWKAALVGASFLVFECAFLAANSAKVIHGGWFPLLVGAVIFTLMSTWSRGRAVLGTMLQERTVPLRDLLSRMDLSRDRVPGTAVFMYGNRRGTPPAMISNLRHNRVLHERILLLAVEIGEEPFIAHGRRLQVEPVDAGIYRVALKFGFMDRLDIPAALRLLQIDGQPIRLDEISYFLGKETLIPKREKLSGLAHWREHLFAIMVRNATDATKFFHLPPEQVVELGTQLEI
jgi:KUP system potassium uptake protein